MNNVNKTKTIVLSLLLLIGTVVIQQNAARSEDVGKCHYRNHSDTKLDINDALYTNKYDFKFVIEDREIAKVEPMVSKNQLTDLRRQLIAADILYQDVLGLTPPLDKQRYQKAGYIRVIMAAIDGYGLAYDDITAYEKIGLADCRINIKFNAPLKAANGTPAHELFHLYFNSYSMFKNGWLTEGTARWSESLLSKGIGKKVSTSLPQTRNELKQVMASSYAASAMWTRLFQLVDEQERFTVPSAVESIHYLNGTPVVKDNKAYGTTFIKGLFEALEEQSKQAANDRGWETYNWKESDQKSADNNTYVWKAVQNAVNKAVPKAQQSEELKRFISISLSSS